MHTVFQTRNMIFFVYEHTIAYLCLFVKGKMKKFENNVR